MFFRVASVVDHDDRHVEIVSVHANDMTLVVPGTRYVKLSEEAAKDAYEYLKDGAKILLDKERISLDEEVNPLNLLISTSPDITKKRTKAIHSMRQKYESEANKLELLDTYNYFIANNTLIMQGIFVTVDNIDELVETHKDSECIYHLNTVFSIIPKLDFLSKMKHILDNAEIDINKCEDCDGVVNIFNKAKSDIEGL